MEMKHYLLVICDLWLCIQAMEEASKHLRPR